MQHGFCTPKEDNHNDLEARVNELSKWMLENGLEAEQISCVEVKTSSDASEGRCLVSTRFSSVQGTSLVRIPAKFLINYRFALAQPKINSFLRFWRNNSNATRRPTRYDALMLLLINARLNPGTCEFIEKFAATLPSDFDTPEYFDTTLVGLLPAHVKSEVESRLSDLRKKFANLSCQLADFESFTGERLFSIDTLTWEVFKWAFCSMNSRVFYAKEAELCGSDEIELAKEYFGDLAELNSQQDDSLENICTLDDYKRKSSKDYEIQNEFSCMAPIIDFANHSSTPNARGQFSDGCYQFVTLGKIRKGDQVAVTYGNHSNQTLLVEYGFVMHEGTNAFDKLVFYIDDFKPIFDSIIDENRRRAALSKCVGESLFENLACDRHNGPSYSMTRLLEIVVRFRDAADDLESTESEDLTTEICMETREIIMSILGKYESSLVESRASLESYKKRTSRPDHVDMVLNLISIQLEIVKFNLELARDNWISLFS